MKRISILIILVFAAKLMFGQRLYLEIAQRSLVANIDVKDRLTYSLSTNGSVIVEPSTIAMNTSAFAESNFLGKHTALFDSTSRAVKPLWEPPAKLRIPSTS